METVTAMTYNVRHAVLDDGENAWDNRREGVAERIQTVAPDIVGVQECTGDQHTELAADLPAYEWLGVADDPGSGEHTPIDQLIQNETKPWPITTWARISQRRAIK